MSKGAGSRDAGTYQAYTGTIDISLILPGWEE